MKKLFNKIIIFVGITLLLFEKQISYITGATLLTYFDEALILFLFLLSCLLILQSKKVNLLAFKILIGTFIFLLTGIISAFLNSDTSFQTVLNSSYLSIKFFLVIIAGITLSTNKDIVDYFIKILDLFAIISILIAFLNMVFPETYIEYFPWGSTRERFGIISPTSIFEHPGTYGWFMMLTSSYHYINYNVTKSKESFYKFLLYAIFALFSMRAKVILTLIATIVVGNFVNNRKGLQLNKIVFTLIATILIAFLARDFLLDTFLMYFTETDDVSARASLNINSLNILKDYLPFGVGFGNFGTHYSRINYSEFYYQYDMNNVYGLTPSNPDYVTDTFWPAILGETGLVGIILFVTLLLIIIKSLYKTFIINKNNKYVIFAIVVLSQTLLESLGAPTFNSPPQNVIIGMILVIGIKSKFFYENKFKQLNSYIYYDDVYKNNKRLLL